MGARFRNHLKALTFTGKSHFRKTNRWDHFYRRSQSEFSPNAAYELSNLLKKEAVDRTFDEGEVDYIDIRQVLAPFVNLDSELDKVFLHKFIDVEAIA